MGKKAKKEEEKYRVHKDTKVETIFKNEVKVFLGKKAKKEEEKYRVHMSR